MIPTPPPELLHPAWLPQQCVVSTHLYYMPPHSHYAHVSCAGGSKILITCIQYNNFTCIVYNSRKKEQLNRLSCQDCKYLEYEGEIVARSHDTLPLWSWQDGAKIWHFALLHLATLGNNKNIFHNVWKSPERLWHGWEVLRFFSKIRVIWIRKSHMSHSKGRRYIIQRCGWSETKWNKVSVKGTMK